MTVSISNITNNQSFGVLLDRMNQVADVISTNAVTTGTLAGGAYTTGNAYVNGMFGSNTIFATYIAGGNISTQSNLVIISNTTVNNYLTIGNSTVNAAFGFVSGTLTIGSFDASINSFAQVSVRNQNTGPASSADIALYNDVAGESTFIDVGITGSNWSNTLWTIGGASDGYLYTSNADLTIGTNTANPVIFFANGTLSTNEVARITPGANVGIGNTNPNAKLQVTGTANISGPAAFGCTVIISNNLSVARVNSNLIPNGDITYSLGNSTNKWSSLYVGGNTVFINTVSLSVAGDNLSLSGGLTVGNTLNVTNATTFANSLSVTGNTTIANTLAVTGNTVLSNTLAVTGGTTLSNTFVLNGSATLNSTLTANGITQIANTLTVTGNTTLSNTLAVTGNTILSNTLAVTGATTIASTIAVTGNATFSNAFIITGNTTLSNTLAVTGNATLSNTLAVTGATTIANTLAVTGAATVGNTLAVTNTVTFSNTLAVTGATTFANTVGITGAVTVGNTLSVTNTITLSNTLSVTGAATLGNTLSITGAVTVTNSVISLTTSNNLYITVGNSVTNSTVNATAVNTTNVNATTIAGTLTTVSQPNITANNALFLNGNTAATLRARDDTAYTNAVAYADNIAGASLAQAYTYADAQSAVAFANAVNFANGVANNAYANAVTYSTNASNLGNGLVPSARISGSYTGITAIGTLVNLTVSNSISVSNSIAVTKDVTVSGNLSVTGNLSITGTTILNSIQTGDVIPASNSFFLGNTTARWNLIGFTINLASNATFTNVVVSNTATINNISVANLVITTNLTSSGTTTINGLLNVANSIVVTGSANIVSTLGVGGAANVGGDLRVAGSLFITGNTVSSGSSTGDLIPIANGVALGESMNRFIVFGTSGDFSNTLVVGETITVNSISQIYSTKYNVSGSLIQTADSWSASTYRSAEYLVQLKDTTTSSHQISKLLVLHDGTTPYITEYGTLVNNSTLGIFAVDINTGNVRLRLTPTSSTVNVIFTRTTLVV